ncbi:hypothetical protein [Ferruginibacter sp. SUN106]|uniref:hypothetical protein n=1 Tax=Ferruginibacter sp. SUN106 TaxID=2978348 RepID=UPI003D35C67B
MKRLLFLLYSSLLVLATGCLDLTNGSDSPGKYTELSKVFCPDSSKYLLTYRYEQGAWDGGRVSLTAVLHKTDSLKAAHYSLTSLDFDKVYWKGNDTVIVEEKYSDFISEGKSKLKDTLVNGIAIKIIQRDPIDTSYQRKIISRETSPDNLSELLVYRYIKPSERYHYNLLNISVINKGDSIPKYGNFYISRYDFDCFNDIRWDSTNALDIKVSSSCYYAFADYLVKNKPAVKFTVKSDDEVKGNINQAQ